MSRKSKAISHTSNLAETTVLAPAPSRKTRRRARAAAPAPQPSALAELLPEALRRVCDPAELPFTTTEDLPPLGDIIGQARAMRALDFGTNVASHGFNIFALGLPGSGKTTIVRKFLERKAAEEPVPPDLCYVNNFADPHRPRALRLPPGRGEELRRDMAEFVSRCRQAIPKAFENEEYEREKNQLVSSFQARQAQEFERLQTYVREHGFALVKTPGGLILTPAVNGHPLSERELEQLSDEQREKVRRLREILEKEIERGLRAIREAEKEMRARLHELDVRTATFAIGHIVEELKAKYAGLDEVVDYLEAVQADVIENANEFRKTEESEAAGPLAFLAALPRPTFSRYQVNVLVDHSQSRGAPVIVESNPTYHNLIGRIEHQAAFGAVYTDFTLIKPGALHRANGGYLIIPAREVLINPFAWDALKRALKDRCIRIEELGAQLSLVSTVTLEPQPIPLDVKIVLIGNPLLYYLLYAYDEDFQKLFKVKADFATMLDRTPENVMQYALFVAAICRQDGLRPFDREAVAAVVEHGARLAGDQEKLSARFGEIADLLHEANFWAGRNGHTHVTAADVRRAIEEKRHRSNLVEERLQEVIAQGTLMIDVTGEALGRVNGLSVVELGDYAFAYPSRVTAVVSAGRTGIVDIQREVKLGGPIHSKGVLILSAYLGHKYGQEQPLSLSASLVFEQSYSLVEGDSASLTETLALLSALSGIPLKQGIAVTGSINQHGQVQPVGGINEKIEGFFDACKARGLTGEQGVIIPAGNVRHLMLREDVVEAVRAGQFHIWPITTVDEGLELLTGRPAGERGPDGTYPEGTVNRAVMDRLRAIAEAIKRETAELDRGRRMENGRGEGD